MLSSAGPLNKNLEMMDRPGIVRGGQTIWGLWVGMVMLGSSAQAQSIQPSKWRSEATTRIPVRPTLPSRRTVALRVFQGNEDEVPRGPSAIAAGENGQVLVVDGENRRAVVLKLGSRRLQQLRTVALPRARAISDVTHVEKNRFMLFNRRLKQIRLLGATQEEDSAEPPKIDRKLLERFKGFRRLQDKKIVIESAESFEIDAADESPPPPPPPPPAKATRVRPTLRTPIRAPPPPIKALPTTRRPIIRRQQLQLRNVRVLSKLARKRGLPALRGRSFDTVLEKGQPALRMFAKGQETPKTVRIPPAVPGVVGSTTLLAVDRKGRSFVRVEVITSTNPIQVRRFIHVVDADLNVIDRLEYPVKDVIVPPKDVDIDRKGNIYIMLPYRDRVEIRRYLAPGAS